MAAPSSAQDASCKPLLDAARKALTQPGIERTSTFASPAMTVVARKTAAGWFHRIGDRPWAPIAVDPEVTERKMLDAGIGFTSCVAGAVEPVNGEPARIYTYQSYAAGPPVAARMWVSVARGLPLKVQGDGLEQVSVYQNTPFPKP